MLLLSPQDDFVLNTLAAIPGVLAKLRYMAGLRTSTGQYRHWGLEKVHGETPAAQAMARAHTDAWIQFLRTPLPELFQELQQNHSETLSPSDYLRDLAAQVNGLVPEGMAGGSLRHFNSILATLAALCRARQGASRQAA